MKTRGLQQLPFVFLIVSSTSIVDGHYLPQQDYDSIDIDSVTANFPHQLAKDLSWALQQKSSGGKHGNDYGRSLQDQDDNDEVDPAPIDHDKYECGEILANWTSQEMPLIMENFLNATFGASPTGDELRALILPQLQYGVQLRKLCATCQDFESALGKTCGYGGNVPQSGLILLPLADNDDDSKDIAEGTHMTILYNHGATATTQPTTDFDGPDGSSFQIMMQAAYTSVNRMVSIMPDYLGQGEGFGETYRGYIIRRAYEETIVSLYLQAGKLLQEGTECSDLADAVYITGYSEGGFASAAVAFKLAAMGKDIIRMDTGGALFWISGATCTDIFRFANTGIYPEDKRLYLQYLSFSFSSSYTDVVNNGQGQDLLTAEQRERHLEFLASDAAQDANLGEVAANAMVPVEDMLSIVNPTFRAFIEAANDRGDPDPCVSQQPLPEDIDILCQALIDQNLHLELENVTFPAALCHSYEDNIISYGNIPQNSSNPFLVHVPVNGTHEEAAGSCFFVSLQFLLGTPELREYPVEDKRTCGDVGNGNGGSNSSGIDVNDGDDDQKEEEEEEEGGNDGGTSNTTTSSNGGIDADDEEEENRDEEEGGGGDTAGVSEGDETTNVAEPTSSQGECKPLLLGVHALVLVVLNLLSF